MTNLDSILKSRYHIANKDPCSQSYGFSSSHVRMWELDHKEGWAPENWCFWTVVLENTLESPLGCKEIKPVSPKGNQSWIFIRRTDAEAEVPVLWPPDSKSQLSGKDPEAGKDWGWEEKGGREDGLVGWHHQLNGHELEQTPGDGEGQGSLACWGPWSHKELDTPERLNNSSSSKQISGSNGSSDSSVENSCETPGTRAWHRKSPRWNLVSYSKSSLYLQYTI